jgi:hypothetical protein
MDGVTENSFNGAQYVTQKTHFLHPSLVLHFFFSTPHVKLTPGVQIGGRLLIANHLDQSLWLANRGVAVKSYILYLFISVRSYLLRFNPI